MDRRGSVFHLSNFVISLSLFPMLWRSAKNLAILGAVSSAVVAVLVYLKWPKALFGWAINCVITTLRKKLLAHLKRSEGSSNNKQRAQATNQRLTIQTLTYSRSYFLPKVLLPQNFERKAALSLSPFVGHSCGAIRFFVAELVLIYDCNLVWNCLQIFRNQRNHSFQLLFSPKNCLSPSKCNLVFGWFTWIVIDWSCCLDMTSMALKGDPVYSLKCLTWHQINIFHQPSLSNYDAISTKLKMPLPTVIAYSTGLVIPYRYNDYSGSQRVRTENHSFLYRRNEDLKRGLKPSILVNIDHLKEFQAHLRGKKMLTMATLCISAIKISISLHLMVRC